MQIQTLTRYCVGGAEFDSEAKAREWLFDQMGATLDKALSDAGAGSVGPKERLVFMAALTSQANTIHRLLGAYIAPVDRS